MQLAQMNVRVATKISFKNSLIFQVFSDRFYYFSSQFLQVVNYLKYYFNEYNHYIFPIVVRGRTQSYVTAYAFMWEELEHRAIALRTV